MTSHSDSLSATSCREYEAYHADTFSDDELRGRLKHGIGDQCRLICQPAQVVAHLQVDVAFLAPISPPAVSHDPIWCRCLFVVADKLHAVVNVAVRRRTVSLENPTCVVHPGRGIYTNAHGC
eukprot:gnl/TRDRNA2_/TRDRNA2_83111_c0_seq1.p1 gnl/TRDRNA2_/TRDRNA2_83111_c0~~gnl/TRDRNA2_/TRDRNA2_83111_c0_seq1.p1  ORF type:complete len:122 (-),score=1.41 gnl/TRDRNA2_/TRDRNA2_83111_c0_seq1:559-924(-)